MNGSTGPLPFAQLTWRDGAPFSPAHQDIYFNPQDGLAETRHVFLDGTGMPDLWRGARHCTVGELGFGTGLNFLATWQLWKKTKHERACLDFLSIEAAPLTPLEMARAHEPFPELSDHARLLREALPPRARGRHTIALPDGVTLHLLYGDAEDMMDGLMAQVDAWFLDGFAPSKNAAMWSPAIMRSLARCSANGARLATFSSAGAVRGALSAAGFTVAKTPGFGRKRHMVQATYEGTAQRTPTPWFTQAKPPRAETVAVIGAGIAGQSVARALRRRHLDVRLIGESAHPGSNGSSVPRAIIMPRLSAMPDAPARFYAAAHRFARSQYGPMGKGGLHLAPHPGNDERLTKMAASGMFDPERVRLLDAEQASDIAGTRVTRAGLFFEDAGAIAPQDIQHPKADIVEQVGTIDHDGTGWQIADTSGQIICNVDVVVVAAGIASRALLPMAALQMERRYGQISRATGAVPALPIAFGGYATPDGEHMWIGATHQSGDEFEAEDRVEASHAANMRKLAEVMPDLAAGVRVQGDWSGLRATTPDRLPLAGPITDASWAAETYAPLGKGQTHGLPDALHLPGLHVLTGLGSRGFVSAPLLGELIAAQICGTPIPVESEVAAALHPLRFLIRHLKRGKTLSDI